MGNFRLAGVSATVPAAPPSGTFRLAGVSVTAPAAPSSGSFRLAGVSVSAGNATLVWNGTSFGNGVVGSATANFVVTPTLSTTGSGNGSATANFVVTPRLTTAGSGSPNNNPNVAAFAQPDNVPTPRVLIEAANISGTSAEVYRVGPDGIQVPVRFGDPAILNSGSIVIYDYEAPYNQPCTYQVVPSGAPAAVAISPPVTVAYTGATLAHPGLPDLSRRVFVESFGAIVFPSTSVDIEVHGRQTPITHSEGRRKSGRFQLGLYTQARPDASGSVAQAMADEADLLQLFDDESVLLLQVADPRFQTVYKWVSLKDVTDDTLGMAYGHDWRSWQFQCTTVARPTGSIQSQRTWADLIAECPTWADVEAMYGTWLDVLIGHPTVATPLGAGTVVIDGGSASSVFGSVIGGGGA